MKRNAFIKILEDHGVVFYRHGSEHDIYIKSETGKKVSVPRHGEIENTLVKLILKELRIKNN
jgi:predicted RNA binding protein YcfA (HicA-like mRNA interferase family)